MNRRDLMLAGLGAAVAAMGARAPAAGSALAAFRQGFARCRFGQIHYWQGGGPGARGKPPLLCLHASPGSSRSYTAFLPLMAARRPVYAVDTPGFGLSDPPSAQPGIEDYAAAVIELADALELRTIDLLGNHTSSSTALEIAVRRSGLVRRIVLNSVLVYAPEDIARLRQGVATYAGQTFDAAAGKVATAWPKFRAALPELSDADAWAFFWEANRNPTLAIWGYEASFRYDAAAALRRVTQPVLVLSPDDVLRGPSLRARGLLRHGEVMELPWSSGTFSAHAAEMARIIEGFLQPRTLGDFGAQKTP